MENNLIIDTTDRISQLPECIVHHILSFLDPPLNLIRMSVLSKEWFHLTASFPILDFNIEFFTHIDYDDYIRNMTNPWARFDDNVRGMFFKYVEYTTSRFLEQNLSAHTVNLISVLKEPKEVDILDECLGLILKKGVWVLEIDIRELSFDLRKYCLPNILLSSSLLTSLKISRCELPSSLMVDGVKFKSLKHLSLNHVRLDEQIITYLTTSCHLLEEFNVECCIGFKTFYVYRHQKLQKVTIYYDREVERIDIIEAPNLCYLHLIDWNGRSWAYEGKGKPSMNLASCKKLTTLSYDGYPYANILSNFPFIESFYLTLPGNCENLKLLSPSLKRFLLISKCVMFDLDNIDINTPNLILFQFNGYLDMLTPLVSEPPESKTHVVCYMKFFNKHLLYKLWLFLLNTGFILWKLHISSKFIEDIDELQMCSPREPFELDHVSIDLHKEHLSMFYVPLVESLLYFCRPRSLSLKSILAFNDLTDRSHVVKSIYERLIIQEDQDGTNIQIVLSSSSQAKKHFSSLNAYLTASPYDLLVHEITFIKEKGAWNSQGFADLEI